MHETDGNGGWYQWSNSTFYSFDKVQILRFALLAHFFKIDVKKGYYSYLIMMMKS